MKWFENCGAKRNINMTRLQPCDAKALMVTEYQATTIHVRLQTMVVTIESLPRNEDQ